LSINHHCTNTQTARAPIGRKPLYSTLRRKFRKRRSRSDCCRPAGRVQHGVGFVFIDRPQTLASLHWGGGGKNKWPLAIKGSCWRNLAKPSTPVQLSHAQRGSFRPNDLLEGLSSRLRRADRLLPGDFSSGAAQTGWLLVQLGSCLSALNWRDTMGEQTRQGLDASTPGPRPGMARTERTVTTTVPAAVRTTTFAEFCPNGPTIRCWSHCHADLQAAVRDGLDHRPRQGVSGHYVPRDTTPISSAGDRLPNKRGAEPCSHRVGLKRCAGPRTTSSFDVSADISVAQRGRCGPFGCRDRLSCRILRHGVQPQCPFVEPATAYGAGRAIFRRSKGFRGQALGD